GEEEQAAFLRETKRLLSSAGLLIISSPDKRYYSEKTGAANPFHRREFYRAEFEDFLRGAFRTVHLLGQKVATGSHMWPLSEAPGGAREPQLVYAGGAYRPAPDDRQDAWYL